MDHGLPLHQPNTGADRARSRSTHRSSDHDLELDRIVTNSGDTAPVPLAREPGLKRFIRRFRGEGRRVPVLNVLLIAIPIAWVGHFVKWTPTLVFTLSLLSITALEKLTDFVGENFALYCGKSIGDLVVVSLDNVVEATLAIILLRKCDLRLMQATIVGVVLLHLLLVPGISFITGGREILHQHLDPHTTELNKSLLTLGVLTLVIPAAFFAGIRNNVAGRASESGLSFAISAPVSDETRDHLLRLSRGLAVVLLVGYVGSRIYLHNPPGEGNALSLGPNVPHALKEKERETEEEEPRLNQGSCLLAFLVAIPLLAITAEWLVDSLERVRETSGIEEEWFGLILLPLVSFSGEALVTIIYYVKRMFFLEAQPPSELANGRTIDLSIQFTMFWMPLFVLIAWWTNRPFILLFDFFEVAIVIGACFLVNSVTDDAKTNWAEGLVLLSFYFMIACSAWFYDGQVELANMLSCRSVRDAVAGGGAS